MSNYSLREAGNISRFYPYDSNQIDIMVDNWDLKANEILKTKKNLNSSPQIAIVPHAGYAYSGFTAYLAYKILKNSIFKRIIVLGPSHYVNINGISIAENEYYETPFGDIEIDQDYVEKLQENFTVDFQAKAHFLEHSTETQMPFIKKYFSGTKVIEIVYGRIHENILYDVMQFILNDKKNGLIVSSDLSHFHSQKIAKTLDNNCILGFKNKIPELVDDCEACGKPGLKAILKYIINKKLSVNILDYRTSGDVTGDKNSVVGYMSAVI